MPRSRHSPRQERLQTLLKAARLSARLTQEDVAAKLRCPQSFVSNYESGQRRLDVVELLEVCEAISLDPQPMIAELLKIHGD
jgi:transcriptional regulator with XRE-family HTH domain